MPERSDRKAERVAGLQRAATDVARAEHNASAKAYAGRIIALFNARAGRGRAPAFFPTIQCALVADMPIVRSVCPGCGQITITDLRHGEWHPLPTVAMVTAKASCKRCRPNTPFAKITGLSSENVDNGRNWAGTWGMMPP
jgi:hypothetical protein